VTLGRDARTALESAAAVLALIAAINDDGRSRATP
jgi:hypothetical protein